MSLPLRTVLATAATAALVLVAGCQTLPSSRPSADGGPGKVSIMVGGLDKVIYMPAELTARLGYFTEQGLDVDLQSQPSGANAETALVARQVDGVVGFYDHTIDLQTKGKCIRSVVQFSNVPGEVEVAGNDSPVRSVADIPGHQLGVTSPGSSTDFLTQYLASTVGADTDGYTTVTAGAGGTFIAALQNGGIDAGMATDPTVQQIKEKGLGRILLDMRNPAGTRAALGGLYPGSSIYMDCDYVRQNPQTVQKLANAFVKTLAYIRTHSAADIAAKMPADYASGSGGLPTYVAAIEASRGMFTADGVMDADGARNVLQVLSRSNPNVKDKADTIDLAATYTTEFVERVPKR